ncbi:uncharacterized protein [Misgurnus anguillicaudatus]|uniref:uncharacterized protein isoform X3 n=1 Tax=Misgurnus anguillicaudatus TaxID=75329 RepID=UPI003CCF24D8
MVARGRCFSLHQSHLTDPRLHGVSCLVHMFKMLTLLSILLLSSHVLPLVQSLNCAKITEYIETFENPVRSQCCKNCAPGQFMVKRCTPGSPNTVCGTCNNGYFTDKYNIMFQWCKQCKKCTKEHMKYEKNCTLTRDAVCTCDDGYICNGSQCDTCVEVKTPRPPFAKPAPFTKHAPSSNPEPFSKPDMHGHANGLCPHQSVTGSPKRATLDPVSAQRKRKRKYRCQCRRCVERMKNWRKPEKDEVRRPLVRVWLEYLD